MPSVQVQRAAAVAPTQIQVTRADTVQVQRTAPPTAPVVQVKAMGPPGPAGPDAVTGAATDQQYYVTASAKASDSNTGLSWGKPFATIGAAVAALGTNPGVINVAAGTFTISTKITLNSGQKIRGVNSVATVLTAANSLNTNVIETINASTLTGTNKWLVSDGVPYGMGLEGLRIDGNKANNTSGNGIRFYAKRYLIRDVIVHDCAENGFLTECGASSGQAVTDDMPECEIDGLWSRNNGNHGVYFRGPHDGHVGAVYTVLNGNCGFVNETVTGSVGGLLDVDFIHSYGNAVDGVQALAPMSVNNLISESNGQRGLYVGVNATRPRIGSLFAFNNNATSTTNPSVEIACSELSAGSVTIRCDNGGVGFRNASGSLFITIGALNIDGQNTGGVGLDVVGNSLIVGAAAINNFSGAGGTGLRVAAGVSQISVTAEVQNNATAVNYLGGTTRSNFSLRGFIATGQTDVAGTKPGAGNTYTHAFGGPGASTSVNNLISGSSWNAGHAILGTYHMWIDSTGTLRVKSGSPSSDTDGTAFSSSSPRSTLIAPTGSLAVTYSRDSAASNSTQALPAAGTVQVSALAVEKSITASKVNFQIGTTAGAGTAGNVHQWVALTDASGNVLAVTADQTLTALSGKQSWSFAASAALTPGLYFLHLCLVMNTTMPTVYGRGADATDSLTPVLVGVGATGQSTPPSVGGTLTMPSTSASPIPYMWIT